MKWEVAQRKGTLSEMIVQKELIFGISARE